MEQSIYNISNVVSFSSVMIVKARNQFLLSAVLLSNLFCVLRWEDNALKNHFVQQSKSRTLLDSKSEHSEPL